MSAVANSHPNVVHPLIQYDPASQAVSHSRWSKVWRIAAIVTAIAFISLAAFAVGYANLYLEAQLPIISLIVLASAYPSYEVFRYPWEKADLNQLEAQRDQKIQGHVKTLDTDQKISSHLRHLGISPGIEPSKLKFILARFFYLKTLEKEIIEANQEHPLDAWSDKEIVLPIQGKNVKVKPCDYTFEKVDFSDDKQTETFIALQDARNKRVSLLNKAVECKIEAAYLLKIMESPHDTSSQESFIQYFDLAYLLRRIAKGFGDRNVAAMVKDCKNNKLYTVGEILDMDTTALAKRIFALKGRGFFPSVFG